MKITSNKRKSLLPLWLVALVGTAILLHCDRVHKSLFDSAGSSDRTGAKTDTEVADNTTKTFFTFLGGDGNDAATSVKATPDGGTIVSLSTNANIPALSGKTPILGYVAGSDSVVIKLTRAGAVEWYTFLGAAGHQQSAAVKQMTDGGYLFIGNTQANIPALGSISPLNAYLGNYDGFVVKLNSSGQVSWFAFLGAAGIQTIRDFQPLTDGSVIIVGTANSTVSSLMGVNPISSWQGGNDAWVIRLDTAGQVVWHRHIGTGASDQLTSIGLTATGSAFIIGGIMTNLGVLDGQSPMNAFSGITQAGWVAQLSLSGSVEWHTFVGSSTSSQVSDIAVANDGSIYAAGISYADIGAIGTLLPVYNYAGAEDILLFKLESTGTLAWYSLLGGVNSDQALALAVLDNGSLYVTGQVDTAITNIASLTLKNAHFGSGADCAVIKLNAATGEALWATYFGGAGYDWCTDITTTVDGGVVVSVLDQSNPLTIGGANPTLMENLVGNSDALIVKINAEGTF